MTGREQKGSLLRLVEDPAVTPEKALHFRRVNLEKRIIRRA